MEKEERAAAKAAKVEKTLQRVYAEVNPEKVGEVLRLLKKFAGRERELLDKVCKKSAYQRPLPSCRVRGGV